MLADAYEGQWVTLISDDYDAYGFGEEGTIVQIEGDLVQVEFEGGDLVWVEVADLEADDD